MTTHPVPTARHGNGWRPRDVVFFVGATLVYAASTTLGLSLLGVVLPWLDALPHLFSVLRGLSPWVACFGFLVLQAIPIAGYVARVWVGSPPMPESGSPVHSGSIGPFAWFDFRPRGRRIWTWNADAIREARQRPVRVWKVEGDETTTSMPAFLRFSMRSAVENAIALLIATLFVLGVVFVSAAFPASVADQVPSNHFSWVAPLVLCTGLMTSYWGGLLLAWSTVRTVSDITKVPLSRIQIAQGFLEVDGQRFYLQDSETSTEMMWGPLATKLYVENRSGRVCIRGDHETLRSLEDHLRTRAKPDEPDHALLRRLQQIRADG